MNIKREFLYNEQKHIPIQLLKTNYGITEVNPSFDSNTEVVESRSIEIKFPQDSSSIAMVLDNSTSPEEITEVRSAPPGTSSVNITIKDGKTYSVYIISKEYKDGFIKGDHTVGTDVPSSDRLQITYDDATQQIYLFEDGAMEKSAGRDETDVQQWFGYDGYYEGALIWSPPTIGDVELGLENYWLIVEQNVLGDLDALIKNLDLPSTSQNLTTKEQTVRSYQLISAITDFMNDKRQNYDNSVEEGKLDSVWSFLNSWLPGTDDIRSDTYYIENDDELEALGTDVDNLGVMSDYIHVSHQGWLAGGQEQTQWMTWLTMYMTQGRTFNGRDPSTMLDPQFVDGGETLGKLTGFVYGLDQVYDDGEPWSQLASAGNKIRSFKEEYESLIESLDNLGIPTTINELGSAGWWEDLNTDAKSRYENFIGWLEDKVDSNLNGIAIAGETVWPQPSGSTYTDIVFDIVPPREDPLPPVILFGVRTSEAITFTWQDISGGTVNIRRAHCIDDLDGYASPAPWVNVYTDENIGEEDLDYYYGVSSQYEDGTTSEEVVFHFPSNLTQQEEDDDNRVVGFPQTQEAILQNIRFLKDLINSVDENLWTAYNSSSALMLASMIKLREDLNLNPETNTIVNITNSTIDNSEVEVLWKMVGNNEWQTLETSLTDVGENVKMVDISTTDFSTVGKYIVLVRPKKIQANISDTSGNFVIVENDLNLYTNDNYFYGYNSQIYTPQGDIQGNQKVVAKSRYNASKQYLELSPILDGLVDIGAGMKIELWSNAFIPTMIEVDIVEHNALTLSYSMYGRKELNTDTGLCTIYDYAGNVYKVLSLGTYSNATSGHAVVEYRTPEDETDNY